MEKPPRSLIGKALWILRYRPLGFLSTLRGYVLFRITRILEPLFLDSSQVKLGSNVRIQRLRCVQAEKPGAMIQIGDHSIIYENAQIAAYGRAKIEIGECGVLGDTRIASRYSVKIGNRFVSSWNVFIQDFDPHPVQPHERGRQIEAICSGFRPKYAEMAAPERYEWDFPGQAIEIGDDVWVGANCTILKGARIGNGCIVATGAVVLGGDYPDGSVIAGNPAKTVKTIQPSG